MTRSNATFTEGNPIWANACVGENGLPGYWEYAEGFSKAATILIDLVIGQEGSGYSVDALVYPVCFNMRHSVELRLKDSISVLGQMSVIRGRQIAQLNEIVSHDIGRIWSFFETEAVAFDDRYGQVTRNLNPKIADFADIDATGQTFRYPLNIESKRHLSNIGIINFLILRDSFGELENELKDLFRLNEFLSREYACRTFTKRLSRKNPFEIADMLPPRNQWSEQEFDNTKKMIKNRFDIGSRELTEALNIIQAHHELASQIQAPVPLDGFDEHLMSQIFLYWLKEHGRPSSEESDGDIYIRTASNWHEMLDSRARSSGESLNAWNAIESSLTPQRLACLFALRTFGLHPCFSEDYLCQYNLELVRCEDWFRTRDDTVETQFDHFFGKTNVIYGILRSLYFLRKNDVADQLVQEHDLGGCFPWLEQARSRVLFRKPAYCGYPHP